MKKYREEFIDALEPIGAFLKKHKGRILVLVIGYVVLAWMFGEE